MSEEEKAKEEPKRIEVKLSDLLKQQGTQVDEKIEAQIRNNQELYTTLSRSLLELHNDVRGLRQKGEGLDRVLFSLQQGINKTTAAIDTRMSNLEKELKALVDVWNKTVKEAESAQEAD
jgi:predicted  nucleic acid-binding Zn-ribbon protein